jgi:hypothetical protein
MNSCIAVRVGAEIVELVGEDRDHGPGTFSWTSGFSRDPGDGFPSRSVDNKSRSGFRGIQVRPCARIFSLSPTEESYVWNRNAGRCAHIPAFISKFLGTVFGPQGPSGI